MALNKNQRKYLKGICHDLNPVVILGQKGLTDTVTAELEVALNHHELIKVKLRGDREERGKWIDQIIETTTSELIQKIGQVACFYRRNTENPRVELPR